MVVYHKPWTQTGHNRTIHTARPMFDLRISALSAITVVALVGTAYSLLYNTYLDTSNPLIASLPHPLHRTHYFASKSNFLNVYFIKLAWAWTSGTFLLLWVTSPRSVRTNERVGKWIAETGAWMVFTAWFFGPAIIERVTLASGGECLLSLPSGDILSVPEEYCFTRSTISPVTHPTLFAASLLSKDVPGSEWHARPRLMRGHDVSGHIFLLTMSILFLADQLHTSFRQRQTGWSTAHRLAIGLNLAMIAIWLFATWTTSLYFHSPLEKLSGYGTYVSVQKQFLD